MPRSCSGMNEIEGGSIQRSHRFYRLCAGTSVALSLSAGFLAGYHLEIKQVQTWHAALTRPSLEPVYERSGFKAGFPDLDLKIDRTITPISPLNTHILVVANGLSTQVPITRSGSPEGSTAEKSAENVQITLSSALSDEEQKALTTLLLQSKGGGTFAEASPPRPKPVATAAQRALSSKRRAAALLARIDPSLVTEVDPDSLGKMEVQSKVEVDGGSTGNCGLGFQHAFERPLNDPAKGDDVSSCPTTVSWISKNAGNEGWVRVEGNHHRTTLTLQPAPNGGSTLLLDDAWLQSILIRNGLQLQSGMGAILGPVPAGYRVEFSGRSEETEYFEANHRNYFLILNAEPGSGVIELVGSQNQERNATLFVPVLEDVITYTDLVTPVERDIRVKVVKNSTPDDPDVAGLTVGLSTQTGIQAITRSDGTALLPAVKLVNGFPVFIDVSSRIGGNPGYTYRYEIRKPGDDRVHVVDEVADASLRHWLRQVGPDLSDQSAMVVGAPDRAKLDGFRSLYTAKVTPLAQNRVFDPVDYSILWDGTLSQTDPLEGDLPRFMAVQVPEGLSQVRIEGEDHQSIQTDLIPVSPRVIHVISP